MSHYCRLDFVYVFQSSPSCFRKIFPSCAKKMGNEIEQTKKKSAIKWNDIILSCFLCFGGKKVVLYDNGAEKNTSRSDMKPPFPSPDISISAFREDDEFDSFRKPSKRYREMWLRIGGEPRCILSISVSGLHGGASWGCVTWKWRFG